MSRALEDPFFETQRRRALTVEELEAVLFVAERLGNHFAGGSGFSLLSEWRTQQVAKAELYAEFVADVVAEGSVVLAEFRLVLVVGTTRAIIEWSCHSV